MLRLDVSWIAFPQTITFCIIFVECVNVDASYNDYIDYGDTTSAEMC